MAVVRIVADLQVSSAAAQSLYAELFGLRIVMDHGWIATLAEPGGSGPQVNLMTVDATAPVMPAVSIQVDNLDEIYTAAVVAGLEIVHPLTVEPWGVRRFFIRDPDGNVLNVLEHASP